MGGYKGLVLSITPIEETKVQCDFFNEFDFVRCWGLIVAGVEVEDLTLDNVSDIPNLSVGVSCGIREGSIHSAFYLWAYWSGCESFAHVRRYAWDDIKVSIFL